MADGSLITSIVLYGDMNGMPAGDDGWNDYEWSNPDGAASVTQTGEVDEIETITITYVVPEEESGAIVELKGRLIISSRRKCSSM